MIKHRLGDICTIVSGSTPKTNESEYWEGELLWITPAELKDSSRKIIDTARKITLLGATKTGLTPFPAGTVLLTSRAPIGKVAISGREMYCNQGFKNLICSPIIFNEYLFWFLKSKTDYLNSLGRGATFKEISKAILGNIEISLPDIDQQKHIAKTLSTIDSILYHKQAKLNKLDELVKSQFIEMFGDVIINSKHFPSFKGQELFKFSSGKFLPADQRVDSGVPVYGGNGVAWYTHKALVNEPTIIVGRVGAQCGNIHLTKEPVWISDNAIYIKTQLKKVHTWEYLELLMRILDFHQFADFSGQPKITQKPLENTAYITPPMELQNRFSEFVQQIDKSKLAIRKSLEKTQLLFDSLMLEYFG